MSHPSENPKKRQKTQKTKTFDWKLTLATPQTFKTLLAIVEPTVSNVPFQVCMGTRDGEGAPFTGLRMDAMNTSKVCMVKAAYECAVTVSSTLRNELFCVDTFMLRNLLRDVAAAHEIEMIRYTDSPTVTINTHDKTDTTNLSVSTIQLMDVDCNIVDLDMFSLDFSYVVEIELDRLKHVCRMVNSIRSSTIEFRMDEPETQPAHERHHRCSITADGEGASICKMHHTITEAQNEAGIEHMSVVQASHASVDDDDDLLNKYQGVFPILYMNGVLKSMDRQTIQLYLGEELPLVMHYGLGNDMSYIKIILAPREGDK